MTDKSPVTVPTDKLKAMQVEIETLKRENGNIKRENERLRQTTGALIAKMELWVSLLR